MHVPFIDRPHRTQRPVPRAPVGTRPLYYLQVAVFRRKRTRPLVPRAPDCARPHEDLQVTAFCRAGACISVLAPHSAQGPSEHVQTSALDRLSAICHRVPPAPVCACPLERFQRALVDHRHHIHVPLTVYVALVSPGPPRQRQRSPQPAYPFAHRTVHCLGAFQYGGHQFSRQSVHEGRRRLFLSTRACLRTSAPPIPLFSLCPCATAHLPAHPRTLFFSPTSRRLFFFKSFLRLACCWEKNLTGLSESASCWRQWHVSNSTRGAD